MENPLFPPVGKLGIICMKGCEELGEKIDNYLVNWYEKKYDRKVDTFMIKTTCPRFNTGEAKGVVHQSVRGFDLYILSDVFNYGVTYKMYNQELLVYSNNVVSTYNNYLQKTWSYELSENFTPSIYINDNYMVIANNSNGTIYMFDSKREIFNKKIDDLSRFVPDCPGFLC